MIRQDHDIPLSTAVSASTPGKGPLVSALYAEAEALFLGKPGKGGNVIKTRIAAKPDGPAKPNRAHVLARVVDFETGFFIELTGVQDTQSNEVLTGPFLAYGKLYVSENKNPQLSNTQTKIWR